MYMRGGYGGCNLVQTACQTSALSSRRQNTKRFGSDPERLMREVVLTNRRAAAAMNQASAANPWLAVPIEQFHQGRTGAPANGMITVGDAAAFIDPFTGSGMLLA